MNSTELSEEFQFGITLSHHVFGTGAFLFNVIVLSLIILDTDARGKAYRKYLFSLQFFSTVADFGLSIYAPFVVTNCRIFYADTIFAKYIDMIIAMTGYYACIGGIGASYLHCVYYRRNQLLPRDALFRFHGRKHAILIIVTVVLCVIGLYFVYQLILPFKSSYQIVPEAVYWVKSKATYIVIGEVEMSRPLLAVAIGGTGFPSLVIIVMIIQLVLEIRNGMAKSSPQTKQYQKRAVFSLVMQGVVPTSFLIVPVVTGFAIYVNAVNIGDVDASNDRKASVISVLLVNALALHAFVHSLTILACSPTYRKNMWNRMNILMSIIKSILKRLRQTALHGTNRVHII